jgi:DNA-binding MarR family transcriptional regulator
MPMDAEFYCLYGFASMAEFNQPSLVAAEAAELVSQIIRAREKRATFFGSELFADPAWDIMLELFLAQLTQRKMASSDLGIATPVPMSTALRWIEKLAEGGWIRRRPDPSDHRRGFVELSAKGSAAMHAWIDELVESQPKRAGDDRVRDLLSRIMQGRREP